MRSERGAGYSEVNVNFSSGRDMGHSKYRGNHRSHVRGKGAEAFFRDVRWEKRYRGSIRPEEEAKYKNSQ